MSSEMREVEVLLNKWLVRYNELIQMDRTNEAEQVLRCINEGKRTLLARAEAGADGAVEPFGYFDSQGLSHAGNSTNFRWLLEQHREGKPNWGNLKLLYTLPQDASGDAVAIKAHGYMQELEAVKTLLRQAVREAGDHMSVRLFDEIDTYFAAMQAKEAR